MMFMQLPIELLDRIIQHTLPEGFESVALTCKRIYGQCITFIAHHNELRSRFRTFEYYLRPYGLNLTSASDMLLRIAAEPVVARYIRSATFAFDSRFPTSSTAQVSAEYSRWRSCSRFICQLRLS
jgi:hypothetical protein